MSSTLDRSYGSIPPSSPQHHFESSGVNTALLQAEPEMKVEAFISEFVGTFFLVLTVGFNVLHSTALAPISIGSILMAMIFATGKVSGGHFNPAVTLGVLLSGRGKIDGGNAVIYVIVQLIGGFMGALVYLAVLGASFSLGPGAGHGFGAVIIAEMLFTAALVFVVLCVATTAQDDGNWYYGLAIGFTVMAAAFAIGPISGCSLNPAVTFGVMFSHFIHTGQLRISIIVIYTVASLLGSLLAVGAFYIVREAEFTYSAQQMKRVKYYEDSSPRPMSPSMPHSMPINVARTIPPYRSQALV